MSSTANGRSAGAVWPAGAAAVPRTGVAATAPVSKANAALTGAAFGFGADTAAGAN
jgi:hypothetical protein